MFISRPAYLFLVFYFVSTMQPSGKTPLVKTVQLTQMMRSMTVMNTNEPSGTSLREGCHHLDTTQQCRNILPGNNPENSLIVREALRMNLPHHLVLRSVHNRLQIHGSNYTDLKDLVADLFTVSSSSDQEVPMETDQLEDAMMMNNPVAKKALRIGVPCHLLKPKLRAKILLTGAGHTDLSELLADVNMN